MGKKYGIYILLLAVLFGREAAAQSKKEKAVVKAVEAFKKAMIDADSVSLSALTLSELSYGHSGGKVEDKSAFISALSSGHSDFVSIDLSNQQIEVVKKTAIVRHTLFAHTNDGGKPGTVKLAVLTVWQREKFKWKLLARQAVRL